MQCVICSIAKNENAYLYEWALYHLQLGFSHIYIYDNNDNVVFMGSNNHEWVNLNEIDDIDKLREVYGSRAKLMMECMDKYFPKCVKHTCPEGGIFLFCTMPEGYDSREVMKKALEKGVAFVPGNATMIDDKAVYNTFRMNYSNASEENIEKGIKLLGEVLCELMG